jgi:hypothetical protein
LGKYPGTGFISLEFTPDLLVESDARHIRRTDDGTGETAVRRSRRTSGARLSTRRKSHWGAAGAPGIPAPLVGREIAGGHPSGAAPAGAFFVCTPILGVLKRQIVRQGGNARVFWVYKPSDANMSDISKSGLNPSNSAASDGLTF